MAKLFTPEELEELRKADEEIEESFSLSQEDWKRSKQLDRDAKLDRLDNQGKKIADYQAAYREANRGKYNAYMRDYLRKRREVKKLSLQCDPGMAGGGMSDG